MHGALTTDHQPMNDVITINGVSSVVPGWCYKKWLLHINHGSGHQTPTSEIHYSLTTEWCDRTMRKKSNRYSWCWYQSLSYRPCTDGVSKYTVLFQSIRHPPWYMTGKTKLWFQHLPKLPWHVPKKFQQWSTAGQKNSIFSIWLLDDFGTHKSYPWPPWHFGVLDT